jgi:tRNA dimethylallyltransferase
LAISPLDPRVWFLTGPTAGGKTDTGLELACRLDAEIVSLDSMALYRGMDIGTAKPSAAQRQRVPHHLIDVLDPREECSLAQYVSLAQAAADEVLARRPAVLFVGGTPLYLKALLRGIFQGPPADWELRHRLRTQAAADPASLHRQLAQIDPAAANKLQPGDLRRIIRALEVFQITGTPISQLQQQFEKPLPRQECRAFVLVWPSDVLARRIERRVEAMFALGLVDEVRRLAAQGGLGRTAAQALGYKEVLAYLAGQNDLAATIELMKRRTRQFAKRQRTWFRGLAELRSIAVGEPFDPEVAASRILQAAAPPPGG